MEQFFKQQGYKTLGAGKIYHSQAPPWALTSQVEPANWDFYYPSSYVSHPYQIRAPGDVIYPEDVDNEKSWFPIDAVLNEIAFKEREKKLDQLHTAGLPEHITIEYLYRDLNSSEYANLFRTLRDKGAPDEA